MFVILPECRPVTHAAPASSKYKKNNLSVYWAGRWGGGCGVAWVTG